MLQLHDTRSRQVTAILPEGGRPLRLAVCGPAVAHRPVHLGDLRSYLLADLIRRVAERHGVRTVACQGVIDVALPADGTAPGPAGAGGSPAEERPAPETAHSYEEAFTADAEALNLRRPEFRPRAGESVDLMVELIAELIEQGHAYATPDGSVFLPAGPARSPADRMLWQGTDREPAWPAPWGRGVPTRRLACSAMTRHVLGDRIDVHVGGAEPCLPHHERERAHYGAAAGREAVACRVHGERVLFEGRPMTGPAGGAVTLPEVTAAGLDPLAVRLAFLEHRYRDRMTLTWDALRAADRTLTRWRYRVAAWAESPSAPLAREYVRRAEQALDADLDTPAALRVLRELERDESVAPGARFETFLHLDRVLALDLPREIGRPRPALPPGAAELLAQRERARAAGDRAAADRLRAELAELGVRVADTAEGQVWTAG